MNELRKITQLINNEEVSFLHPMEYREESVTSGVRRIVAGMPSTQPELLVELCKTMAEPYFLLYVLHTTRDESKLGRYQSPALTAQDLEEFFTLYLDFLLNDARTDFWLHTPNSGTTIVCDRHNLLYCYGPPEPYINVFKQYEFSEGNPGVEFPHIHYYHSEYDFMAKKILKEYEWGWSPLQSSDEQ